MVQGTTPTLLFKFSVDLALIKEWRICFYQEGKENLIKTNTDCIVDENKVIYVKLTQEETLNFDVDKYIKIQVKALTQDSNVISSQTITTHTHEILDKMLFTVENTTPTIIDTSAIEFEFNTEPCGFGLDFEDLYIEKVAGGSDITVDSEFSLTSTNPVQNKVITKKINELQEEINNDIGQDGKDGVGIQSVEQTTTSTEDNGKNVITVTLTNGNKSTFIVENGSQGSKGDTGAKGDKGDKGDKGEQGLPGIQGQQGIQGEKGADGYTPVKGKDYFTIEDVQNIVNQVIATLPIEQEVNDSTNPVSSVAVKNEFGRFSNAYDEIIRQAVVTQEYFYNGDTIITAHNKDYHASEDITNLTIQIGTGISSVMFKIVDSGDFNIEFMGVNGYIGKAPDFKNGETWELSIHNGIIASGKVVS